MNKINFTKNNIKNLNYAEKGKRRIYRDTGQKYLSLFVTHNRKTFYYDRKLSGETGKRIQEKIADFPNITPYNAREIAKEKDLQVAKGEYSKQTSYADKDYKEYTFKEIFEKYIQTEGFHNKSSKEQKRIFEKHLKQFHNSKLKEINYENVKNFHNSFYNSTKQDPIMANRCLILISTIFNFARKQLKVDITSPTEGIQKYKESPRQRIMNTKELEKFLEKLTEWQEDPQKVLYADLFLMLFYTGQRKTNVMKMRKDEIDLEKNIWTIKAEDNKNNENKEVILVKKAMDIINRRYNNNNSDYIFPSSRNNNLPLTDPKKRWKKLLAEANLKDDLRIHDIRRTSGSLLLKTTGNLKAVQEFLGHKDISTTANVYTFINKEDQAKSLEKTFKDY